MVCGGCCGSTSGYSDSAPMPGALSRGTPGRRARSRSEPQPGMVADRSISLRCRVVSERPPWTGTSRMSFVLEPRRWSMAGSSVRARRDHHRLDAVVELAREEVVGLADLLERHAVRDHVLRVDVA